jgi:hypothetical protein
MYAEYLKNIDEVKEMSLKDNQGYYFDDEYTLIKYEEEDRETITLEFHRPHETDFIALIKVPKEKLKGFVFREADIGWDFECFKEVINVSINDLEHFLNK